MIIQKDERERERESGEKKWIVSERDLRETERERERLE